MRGDAPAAGVRGDHSMHERAPGLGGRQGRPAVVIPGRIAASLIACAAALGLDGCGHDEPPPPPRPPPHQAFSREDSAATLLRIELDTRLLRYRADDPGIQGRPARLEALDSLLEHIRRTSGF